MQNKSAKYFFQGNECRLLVTHIDYLEENLPQHLNGFLVAFKAFASLEESCFSTELDPYYQDRINDFAEAYKALNLRITPKVVYSQMKRAYGNRAQF